MNVGTASYDAAVSPVRAVQQLLDARAHGTHQDYLDACACIAALAVVSNVNGTARLLELLVDAAAAKADR